MYISEVSRQTGVCYNTIHKWWKQLQEDGNYNPKEENDLKHHALSPRLEEKIINEIEENFLLPGYFFNNQILKMIARAAYDAAPEEDKLRKSFQASTKWCQNFRKRHGYVWRKGHYKRRPLQNETTRRIAENFQATIKELYQKLAAQNQLFLLVNADETSWKLAYMCQLTWAKKGAKEVRISTNYDDKESFTSLCAINAENEKLPLFLLAKGETNRCHAQFGNIQFDFPETQVYHTTKGWSNSESMMEYLKWLRSYYDRKYKFTEDYESDETKIHLILDLHSSHQKENVKKLAEELHIQLYYIPAGMTDLMQPCDIRVFGALKAKARSCWYRMIYTNKDYIPTKEDAARVLCSCWESLSEEVLDSAWIMYAFAVEQEEQQNAIVPGYDEPDSSVEFHETIQHFAFSQECDADDGEFMSDSVCDEEPCSDESNDSDEEWEREDDLYVPLSEIQTKIETENTSSTLNDEIILDEKDMEIAQIRNLQRLTNMPFVVGLTNLGSSCYFNTFMQILFTLPNMEQFLVSDDEIYETREKEQDQNTLYMLKQYVIDLHTKMIEACSQFYLSAPKVFVHVPGPFHKLLSNINSVWLGAPYLLCKDLLKQDKVSYIWLEDLDKLEESISEETLKQVLILHRDPAKRQTAMEFPFEFSWTSQQSGVTYNYSLKLVITNPYLHFIAFKRINRSKSFFKINDSEISKVRYYPHSESHMGVYFQTF